MNYVFSSTITYVRFVIFEKEVNEFTENPTDTSSKIRTLYRKNKDTLSKTKSLSKIFGIRVKCGKSLHIIPKVESKKKFFLGNRLAESIFILLRGT